MCDAVAEFREIVGRDVGGHAHRDARAAVGKKVGELAGKDLGFEAGLVVVIVPVDSVLLEVVEHLHGKRRQAHFGVAHGRRWIAVDGPHVTLTVDERIAYVEILRHSIHGRVDDLLTVRMIVTGCIACDLRGLAVL